MKYQILILGPKMEDYLPEFIDAMRSAVSDVGLSFPGDVEVLKISDESSIRWDGTPVALWFGGDDGPIPQELDLLEHLAKEIVPVFPIVDDLEFYRERTPPILQSVNGSEWQSGDAVACARIVADLMRALRLTRATRQAFISYKRDEASGVATQLFDELVHRGYQVFLDIWSVEKGSDFQQILWDRMADVDLLIFLDSQTALDSRWVKEELARAHALGLGVYQLLWPDRDKPTRGTELSLACTKLKKEDFVGATLAKETILEGARLKEILVDIETIRIRSLAAKRRSIGGEIRELAITFGLETCFHPVDPIALYHDGTQVGAIVISTGVPDAALIHRESVALDLENVKNAKIVYNGLGVRQAWRDHLDWLNPRVPLATMPVHCLEQWLGGLA